MADEKEGAEGAAAEAKPKGSKKLIIIIVAVVLVLVLGGVGAFLALSHKKPAEGEEGAEGAAAEEEEGGKEEGLAELPGAVLPLEVFIVNLQVKGSFLKSNIQLEFADPEPPLGIDNDVPKIRDKIIRIVSSKSAQELLSPDGKEQLRNEIKEGVNEVLGSEDVVQVYFTEFIIQ